MVRGVSRRARTVALAISLAAATAALRADAGEHEATERVVVVTAASGEETFADASRAVSVVGADRAYERAVASTPEMLAEAPGVFLKRTNDAVATPIVRGLLGNRVLVLLDGIRLNTAITRSGRNPALNLVDPFTIERIEVVRGAGAVLHGSDAIGGVVQVIERRPTLGVQGFEVRPEVGLRAGSAASSFQGRATVGASGRSAGLLAGAGGGRLGQLDAGGELGPQRFSGATSYSADGKASGLWGPALVSAEVATVRFVDAPRADSTPEDQSWFELQSRTAAVVRAVSHEPLPSLEAHASFQRLGEDRSRQRSDPAREAEESDAIWGAGAGLEADLLRSEVATVRAGLDYLHERLSSRAVDVDAASVRTPRPRARYVDGASYQSAGLFAQCELRLGEVVSVTPGGRGTLVWAGAPPDPLRPTQPGLALAEQSLIGNLLLKVRLGDSVRVLGSVSQGFRAPNLDDLLAFGSSARAFDAPSGGLSSERSLAGDLGVRLTSAHVSGEAFGFYTALDDLIARRPGSYDGMTTIDGRPVFVRQNADQGSLGGVELAATARVRPVQLTTAAMWTRGVQETHDDAGRPVREPMSRIPPLSGHATLRFEPGWRGAYAEAALAWAARQDRLSAEDRADPRICPAGPDGCPGTPGYAVVSLRAGAELTRQVRLAIVLENLGDALYRNHSSDLYAPGRSVLASLELRDAFAW